MGEHIQLNTTDDSFFYKNILETVTDGVWVTDKYDTIIFINSGMEQIAGIKGEDCLGVNVLTGFPEETIHEFKEYYLQTKNNLETVFYETHVKTPSGRNTVQQGWLTPIIKKGEYQGIICTIHDITEKKKAEKELKETLNATTDGIWTWNFKTNTLFFSDRYYQMLGYEPQEFEANYENWANLIHPEDKEQSIAVAEEYLKHKPDVYENRFRIRTKQGRYRWIQSKARVVERDEHGEAIRLIGTHEDVTEKEKIQQQLKHSEQKYRHVFEMSPIGICTADKKGKITDINQSGVSITSHSREELIGKSYKELHFIDHKMILNILKDFPKILQGKPLEPMELKVTDLEGNIHIVEVQISPIRDDGKFTGTQVTMHDVTEQKKAEKELQKSEEKFRKKNIDLNLAQKIAMVGNWTLDPEVGVPEWSDMIYKIYERDPDKGPIPLKEYKKLYQGKDWEKFHNAITNASQKGIAYSIELQPKLPSGKKKWIRAICEPEKQSKNSNYFLRGTIQDITREKKAEKELCESEEKYRGYIDNAPNGIFLCDETGRYLEINDKAIEITGYSRVELLNMSIHDTHPEERKEIWLHHFQTLLNEGKSVGETPFIHKDGSVRWWQVNAVKICENRLLAFTQDITEKREMEQKLQRIFDMSSELICEADMNTATFTKINPAFMKVLGYSEEELLAHSFLEFIHPDDKEPTQTVIDEQLQTGEKVISFINRYRCKDGSYVWLDWNSHPVPEKGFIYAIARDITDEKMKEKEIIQSKKETEMILNTAADGIRIVTKDFKIKKMNDTFTEMVGISKEEGIGKYCSDVFKSADCGTDECAVRKVLRTGEGIEKETIRTTLDNREIPCIFKASPYKNEYGEIIGVIEDYRDISSLKQSQARFRNIFENKGTATGIFGNDSIITQCNSKFVEQSGYTKDEIIGKMHWYDFVFQDDVNQMMKFHQQRSEGGKPPGIYECRMLRKNGELVTMIVNIGMIPDSDERIVSLVDISKQKTVENELLKTQEELKKLNENLEAEVEDRTAQIQMLLEQKDEFINQLGHDIKNPLGPLVNLLPILENKMTDPKQKDMIRVMNRNVAYIKNLVTRTIQLAQLKSPSTGLKYEEFDLGKVIQDIVGNHQLHFDEKHITVENKIPDGIAIDADKLKIQEVFNNLLNNAVKYNKQQGNIIIDHIKDNDTLTILIKDTGVGMKPEQQKRVFDEFYKADSSRHHFDSSGLGMAITKRIIEMHDGKIWVESEGLGKGSTFYFTLPKSDGKS